MITHFSFRLLAIFSLLFAVSLPAWAEKHTEHVFIVSFDGGKPAVMQQSKMPTVEHLVETGACTWQAQTTFPSITLTSHASMLTGVGPAKHHMLWNEWKPDRGMVTVPTIFQLAHKNALVTAMIVSKPKFIHLFLAHSLNFFALPSYKAKLVADVASEYIKDKKPNLCFIHFTDSDSAGHQYGWGSDEQKKAFADEDDALKTVLKAISDAGIEKQSVVILTADHGGHDKTHGSNAAEDMTIPWIVWGKGVKHDSTIGSVNTCDTAATALWLLDLPIPADFDGKPVVGAFTSVSTTMSASHLVSK